MSNPLDAITWPPRTEPLLMRRAIRRIVLYCFADNEASWRLERVGMRREAQNRSDSLHLSGRWLDGCGYAILADEWRRDR